MQGKLPLRWFPRVSLTVLPPVRLDRADRIGRPARRAALGRIVQDIMVDAAFRPERLRHSLFAALLDAQRLYDRGCRSSPISFRTKPAAPR